MGSLYDTDLVLWAEQQSLALREAGKRSNEPIDWEKVAEEIESLARSDRLAIISHLGVVIEHLVKLQVSPAENLRNGWRASIVRARADIALLLDESPSLRRQIPDMIGKAFAPAKRVAHISLESLSEEPAVDVDRLSFSEQQILGDWFPVVH